MCSPEAAKAVHEAISSSKLVFVEECGHIPWIEKPEVFWNHVNEFLRS